MAVYKNKWLGITLALAIAFSTLLPFFAVHTPSIGKVSYLSSVFGEQVFICSGDGFKWVKLADLQSGKEKPKPHSGDKCPLCYMAKHGLNAVPLPFIAQDYHVIYAPVSIARNILQISLYLAAPLNIRAPPVSFIG